MKPLKVTSIYTLHWGPTACIVGPHAWGPTIRGQPVRAQLSGPNCPGPTVRGQLSGAQLSGVQLSEA